MGLPVYTWSEVEAEVQKFSKAYDRTKPFSRLRSDERVLEHFASNPGDEELLGSFFFAENDILGVGRPFSVWVDTNKGLAWRDRHVVPIRTELGKSWKKWSNSLESPPGEQLGDLTVVLDVLRQYRDLVQSLVGQIASKRVQYKGITVLNNAYFTEGVVRVVALDAIDYLVALFKRRGVENVLREMVSKVVLTQFDGDYAGHYFAQQKKIQLYPNVILVREKGRLLQDWVAEVFLHEVGHHLHLNVLPKDAKAEWDAAWLPIEEARGREEEIVAVSLRDRQRFFALIEASGWSPQKAGRKVKGLDRLKYLAWLANPRTNKILSTPKQVRLTDYGKDMFKFLADPEGEIAEDMPYSDGYTDEERDRHMQRRLRIYMGNLSLNRDADYPRLDPETVEEFVGVDRMVDEAIEALQVPTEYAKTDEMEDFAETFVAFMDNPGALSDNAKFRMQRALSLSGLYGKPIMRLARKRMLRAARLAETYLEVGGY